MFNTLVFHPPFDEKVLFHQYLAEHKPLPPHLLNYLKHHSHKFDNLSYGSILNYYYPKPVAAHTNKPKPSFLTPKRKLFDKHETEILQARLKLFVHRNNKKVAVKIPREQFIDLILEDINYDLRDSQNHQLTDSKLHELLYFHGNRQLDGAPYILGGITPVYFFQWGNLMGIVKYEEITGEKNIDGNILIYFEDMADKNLAQCILEYQNRQPLLITPVYTPTLVNQAVIQPPELAPSNALPSPQIVTPRLTLTLSPPYNSKDEQV